MSSSSSAKLYSYDSLADSNSGSPLALSHQLTVERKKNKMEKMALLTIILIFISYGTFLHVTHILYYPSGPKQAHSHVSAAQDGEHELTRELHSLIAGWSSDQAHQMPHQAPTGHPWERVSFIDVDHATAHSLLNDHLQYNHTRNGKSSSSVLPCVHPLLVQMSKSRVRELHALSRLQNESTTLGHGTTTKDTPLNSNSNNKDDNKLHHKLCTSQVLSDLHFSYDSLFEYDVTAVHHSLASLAEAVRSDALRVQKFHTCNLYGSYYESPYLIETWAHSTSETCPIQIRQKERQEVDHQALSKAAIESKQMCMLQLMALLENRKDRAE